MMERAGCTNVFKRCPRCGFEWRTRDQFLADVNLQMIGYQTNFKELTSGLFYFNHACRGTLTIGAGAFEDLYHGPVFEGRATGSQKCPGYCLHRDDLDPCPAKCECAYVREIINLIRNQDHSADCVVTDDAAMTADA